MQQRYFATAWADIKSTPGWFGKICLLALILFIPVFGAIVFFGYAWGWARDIAWNVRQPMPARIFGNEDGKLYRRGWFALVIVVALALIVYLIDMVLTGGLAACTASTVPQHGYYDSSPYGFNPAAAAALGIGGVLVSLVYFVLSLAASVFGWVGAIRMAIYDRLSAGFQFGKIWKMITHDLNGMARIIGMVLLLSLILGAIAGVVLTIVFFMYFGYAISVAGPALSHIGDSSVPFNSSLVATQLGSSTLVFVLVLLVVLYFLVVAGVFIDLMAFRAVGYWARGFNVSEWRGQNDPLPFEVQPSQQPSPAYYQPQQVAQQQVAQQQAVQQPQQQAAPAVQAQPPAYQADQAPVAPAASQAFPSAAASAVGAQPAASAPPAAAPPVGAQGQPSAAPVPEPGAGAPEPASPDQPGAVAPASQPIPAPAAVPEGAAPAPAPLSAPAAEPAAAPSDPAVAGEDADPSQTGEQGGTPSV